MTCTIAAIIAVLGYMPPKGTVITIPKESAQQYTPYQQYRAKRCAARHGIELRVSG